MERLTSKSLPPPLPLYILTTSFDNLIKIGHLNVHSYLAKDKDIKVDKCVQSTHVMCFTETFLTSQRTISSLNLHAQCTQLFRLDRPQDTGGGGVMVACVSSVNPQELQFDHSPLLEAKGVCISHKTCGQMYIVGIYKRPQLPTISFVAHLCSYLEFIPFESVPTLLLGDFNNNLLSSSHSTLIEQFLQAKGFKQLVTEPTADSGSLLDHIYFNCLDVSPVVDIVTMPPILPYQSIQISKPMHLHSCV